MNKTKAKGCGCLLVVVAVLAIIGGIVGGSHGTNNASQGTSQPSSAPAVSQPAPQASQSAPQPASQPPTQQAGANGLQAVHDPGQVTGSLSGPCQGSGQLPDPLCTPGSIDPAVTQANITQTICRTGYTSTVRPPEADTENFKLDQAYPAYGVPGGTKTKLDHLVPLELGVGSGNTSTTAPAAPAPAPAGGGPVVHPGSFCSPPGATGVTSRGHAEVCSSKNGAEARWRSAS